MKILRSKMKRFEGLQQSLTDLINQSIKRDEYLTQRSKNKKKKVSNQERLLNNIKIIQGIKQELTVIQDLVKNNFTLFLHEVSLKGGLDC
jgi:hypothetical protein